MRKFLFSCTMLAAFGANAAADPFVSGSEPGWGKNLLPTQRRAAGNDDTRVAREYARKPNTPARGVPGYAFNVITIVHSFHGHAGGQGRHLSLEQTQQNESGPFGVSQIKYEPFGVFVTMQECDMARAAKIAQLDADESRFLHQQPNAPTITHTFANGASVTEQVPIRERKDVTFCEPGVYAPESTNNIAQRGIAQ